MAAPKGNQYAVGNKGGFRKGYEYEIGQIKQMKKQINSIFKLAEKIETGKASKDEKERFVLLQKLTLKMMDKIHANKQHVEHDVGDKTLDRMTEAMVKIANPVIDVKIKPEPKKLEEPKPVELPVKTEKTLPKYPDIIKEDEPTGQTSI